MKNENGERFFKIPARFAEAAFGVLLTAILTGVIAINVRFGRIETSDAMQNITMQYVGEWIKTHEQQTVWTKSDHDKFVQYIEDIMASKEWVRENFQETKKNK